MGWVLDKGVCESESKRAPKSSKPDQSQLTTQSNRAQAQTKSVTAGITQSLPPSPYPPHLEHLSHQPEPTTHSHLHNQLILTHHPAKHVCLSFRAAIDPQVVAATGSPSAAASKPASKAKAAKAKAPSSKTKAAPAASKKPASAPKKPTSSTTKKATAPKKASPPKEAAADTKVSMEDMIKDAIKNDKENVRGGVSRPAIKKYLAFRFKVLDTPSNIARLNKAITKGAEKGIFALPKGASGKVKLAKTVPEPKAPKPVLATAKPASKPTVKKAVAAKAAPVKKAEPKKATAVKKTTKKAPTAPTKKVAAAKQPIIFSQ
ncbi:hypothetical protein PSTT_04297 [Puccinia striiformis]|uniref:Histone H1 n=1 Tax=Puccinia striiformis TaxID=27350 RepID=A0A2S4VSR3_9BASI|nr:hypothetical protein PSTT_04297 [Puccinia striiformis]